MEYVDVVKKFKFKRPFLCYITKYALDAVKKGNCILYFFRLKLFFILDICMIIGEKNDA